MFLLQIWIDGVAGMFSLAFRTRERAGAVRERAWETAIGGAPGGGMMRLADDYGTELAAPRSLLRAAVVMDVAQDCERQVDQQILNAKETAKGQAKAAQDKGLALLQTVAQARSGLARPS